MKSDFKKITLTGYVFYCPSCQIIDHDQWCKFSQEFSNKCPSESCPVCSQSHLHNWKILYVPYKDGHVLFDGVNVGCYEDYFSYRANEYYLNIEDDKIFNELEDGEKVKISGYFFKTYHGKRTTKNVFVNHVERLNGENLIHITKRIVDKKYKHFEPNFNDPKTKCRPNYDKKTNWLCSKEFGNWLKIDTFSSK